MAGKEVRDDGRLCDDRPKRVLMVYPTYDRARAACRHHHVYKLPDSVYRGSSNTLVVEGGHELVFCGADNAERYNGLTVDKVIIDETCSLTEDDCHKFKALEVPQ